MGYKYSAEVIGFVELDTIGNQLDELAKEQLGAQQMQPDVATHILALL